MSQSQEWLKQHCHPAPKICCCRCVCCVPQTARSSVAREADVLQEQRAAVASMLTQLERREGAVAQAEAELDALRAELLAQQQELTRRTAAVAATAKDGAVQV